MQLIPTSLHLLQNIMKLQTADYRVKFTKKDGSERIMTCSNDVPNNGGTLKYNPSEKGLKVVWSVEDQECRMISMDNLLSVTVGDMEYYAI